MIFALDPGTEQTGFVVYSGSEKLIADHGVLPNAQMLDRVMKDAEIDMPITLAIEMIASYGMPVGREVFETCVWIGRFRQAWRAPDAVRLAYRKDVKMHLCGTARAKDGNVWQALKDRLGEPGTKKDPGRLYGVQSHARAALAVAVYTYDMLKGELR